MNLIGHLVQFLKANTPTQVTDSEGLPVSIYASSATVTTASDAIGAKADASATTDTGTFSLISLIKRLLTKTPHDSGRDVLKTEEQNGVNKNHTDAISLVDTTNIAAGTNYYPSTSGLSMDTFKSICFHGVISGGVTATIEGTNDPAASPDWEDITLCFTNLKTGAGATANYIDTNFMLQRDSLNVKYVRIKSVTADNSNAVQYSYRQIPL